MCRPINFDDTKVLSITGQAPPFWTEQGTLQHVCQDWRPIPCRKHLKLSMINCDVLSRQYMHEQRHTVYLHKLSKKPEKKTIIWHQRQQWITQHRRNLLEQAIRVSLNSCPELETAMLPDPQGHQQPPGSTYII